MSGSIDEHLRPTKFLCDIIGMWPMNAEYISLSKKGFSYFRKLFSLLAIGNIVIPEILAIIESHGDLTVVTRVGCVFITVGLLVYKMIYLMLNGAELSRVYIDVRDFWGTGNSIRERKVYEKFAHSAKIFTIIFLISGFGNNVTFTSAAIFGWVKESKISEIETKSTRHLPLEVRYGFDIESSPNYEITFICQTVSAIFCCVGIVGLDSLMMTLVLHVSGQFALIKFWYSDIGSKIIKEQQLINGNKTISMVSFLHEDIDKCLRHHQKIIKVADQLEALLSPIIFAQLVTGAGEICLSGYAVTTGINNTMDMVRFTNYLISMIVQLFAWCVVGEILMTESGSVCEAIFHDVPWYWFPVDLQGDLRLVIRRSQKPCCLTAAKFQIMNVKKLGEVLSSAASYFAVLRQMKKEEEGEGGSVETY